MSTNWALPDQYAAIGAELAQLTGGQAVGGPGEVGTLAFHAQVLLVPRPGYRIAGRPPGRCCGGTGRTATIRRSPRCATS
ncbi:MAG TPA: hypothetical protein VF734_04440 [Pseudonocardiaceae bacterium]